MQWYYLSDSHERIAVSDEQLPLLVSRGVLRTATMIWRRGMSGWSPCGEIKPELFTAAAVRTDAQPHPAADAAAVRGAVAGLARSLAGYAVWMRTGGVLLLLLALAGMITLAQAAWFAYDRGIPAIMDYLPWRKFVEEKDAVTLYVSCHAGVLLISAFLFCVLGVLLLRTASRAVQARNAADETALHAALRSTGAWFATGVLWALLNIIFWLGLTLWIGWDKLREKPESPATPAVSI